MTTLRRTQPMAAVALLWCLVLVSGCSAVLPVPDAAPAPAADAPIAAYARVLSRYVNERGEVDFPALAREPRDLDRYIDYVARTPLSSFPDRNELLAHLINSYNALSMFNVIALGIPTSHAGLGKLRAFVLQQFVIGGTTRSLRGYENDVIRRLGEPRVHFALNCSARSCPTLPRTPFTGARLDEQLEREARRFLSEPRNLLVDPATRTVWLSAIFDFYREDFLTGDTPDLIAYVNRHAATPAPEGYRVRFFEYDWRIANARTPYP